MTQTLALRSTDGLLLEAKLDGPEEPSATLVLCHPHPKMGGTMNAPLLTALTDDMSRRGWAVLRFNFRGIGDSEGQPGTGVDEVADAAGAISEAQKRWDSPIAIAGWSFGGAVAIRTAMETPGLAGAVGIAPAVKEKPGTTAGLPEPGEVRLTCPLLVVCGTNDELVDPEAARGWTSAAGGRYLEMKGANHFFWAKYDALAEAVGNFLEEVV